MIREIYIRTPDDPNFVPGVIDFKNETEYLLNQIRMLLGTKKGDVLEEYNFGADLESFVFNTVRSASEMEKIIDDQISIYVDIPQSMTVSTEVSFGDSGKGYDIAVVDIIINGNKCMGFLIDK